MVLERREVLKVPRPVQGLLPRRPPSQCRVEAVPQSVVPGGTPTPQSLEWGTCRLRIADDTRPTFTAGYTGPKDPKVLVVLQTESPLRGGRNNDLCVTLQKFRVGSRDSR